VSPFRSHPRQRAQRKSGFTLLEALLVLVIGGLVMAAAGSVISAVLRSQRAQLLVQQRRSDWSRFTTFLSHEVGEGSAVSVTPPASNPCATSMDSFLFSIAVPIATNTGAPVDRQVHYYTTGTGTNTTVFRCGPGIETSGRLQSAGTTTARLIAGIPLAAAVDANNVIVTLTPSISGANIGPFAVRTRSIAMD